MLLAFLYELVKRKWLFVAIGIGLIISLLPTQVGLTRDGLVILGVALGSVIIFITEPIPLPTVALLIAIIQVIFLGYSADAVAQSFMKDSVFFIMGSLMLAVAFVKQKLDRRMAYLLLRATRGSTSGFALGVLISSAFLASLIGEHTVAAIMLPVVVVVIKTVEAREGYDKGMIGLLLFSLAYGCTIAGVGTPSGGARNAIMMQYFKDLYGMEIGYSEWVVTAYPMILLALPAIWFLISAFNKPRTKKLTVVLTKLREEVKRSGRLVTRDWLTLGIFMFTLVLWLTMSKSWGLGIVAMIGASLYLLTGCVEWKDINSGVNWGAVLLYAAAMSLGVAMKKTEAAGWVATNLLQFLTSVGLGTGIGLIISVAIIIAVLTNAMSSGAAVAVLGPIILMIAEQAGVDIMLMGFVTVIASAFGFVSVGSHPGIMIVYSSGLMPASGFVKMGWKVALISIVILVIFASTYLSWITG
jgi:sodium-dependent dicarboxylate transporter 2/3/5